MKKLGLGIIGCGCATTELHLPALRSVPAIAVVAAADVELAKAQDFARSLGDCRAYSAADQLLKDPRVEAVAVCTPPAAHAEAAVTVLEAGKHLLLEKPLATSAHDALRIVGVAAAGTTAAMAFNLRFHRFTQHAREVIASGALGRIYQVVSHWGTSLNTPETQWRGHVAKGGGALADLAPHHIDLCRFLLHDEFESVYAIENSFRSEADTATLLGRMRTDVCVSSTFSLCAAPTNQFAIVGDKATISFAFDEARTFRVSATEAVQGRGRRALDSLRRLIDFPHLLMSAMAGGEYRHSYSEQWRGFAAAVRGEQSFSASLHDGLAALQVTEAARRSSLSKTPQAVSRHA